MTTGANVPFLPDNAETLSNANVNTIDTTSGTAGVTLGLALTVYASPTTNNNSVPADVTMADTYQSTSLYTTPELIPANITIAGGGSTTGIVGVVPFVWVRTPTTDAGGNAITNVNPSMVNLLYGAGHVVASFFTGNAAHTSQIYAAGRDPDSGSRLATFGESGLGANATVKQYRPTGGASAIVAGSTSFSSVELWPTTTVTNLGQTFTNGNAGESSGGTLVGYLKLNYNAGAVLGYAGATDVAGVIAPTAASGAGAQTAVVLSYNGVSLPYSVSNSGTSTATATFDYTNIKNGSYTFWTYEQMLYSTSITTTVKAVGDKIASQIYNVDAVVLVPDMLVSRPGDGAQVSP